MAASEIISKSVCHFPPQKYFYQVISVYSGRRPAAVYHQVSTIDIGTLVAGQEQGGIGNIHRLAQSA